MLIRWGLSIFAFGLLRLFRWETTHYRSKLFSKLRSGLRLDIQRAGINRRRKLGQGTSTEINVECHLVGTARHTVGIGDGHAGQLKAGIGAAEMLLCLPVRWKHRRYRQF